ncbi:hypothetical protein B0H14DRAFT_983752 [Mycena olivaceomarginata]|nr:hypothetical protein B0H14DRAFT_983752 [Mycena olivaceomarginata]
MEWMRTWPDYGIFAIISLPMFTGCLVDYACSWNTFPKNIACLARFSNSNLFSCEPCIFGLPAAFFLSPSTHPRASRVHQPSARVPRHFSAVHVAGHRSDHSLASMCISNPGLRAPLWWVVASHPLGADIHCEDSTMADRERRTLILQGVLVRSQEYQWHRTLTDELTEPLRRLRRGSNAGLKSAHPSAQGRRRQTLN